MESSRKKESSPAKPSATASSAKSEMIETNDEAIPVAYTDAAKPDVETIDNTKSKKAVPEA